MPSTQVLTLGLASKARVDDDGEPGTGARTRRHSGQRRRLPGTISTPMLAVTDLGCPATPEETHATPLSGSRAWRATSLAPPSLTSGSIG